MDYVYVSIIGAITGTLSMILVYLYLYSMYRERYIGIWAIAWSIFLLRNIFFDSGMFNDLFHWNQSLLSFTIYQLFFVFSSLVFVWGTYIFIGKTFNKAWLYGAISASLLSAILFLQPLPIVYKVIPPAWFGGIVLAWISMAFFRHSEAVGIGKSITGTAFLLWSILTLIMPFFIATFPLLITFTGSMLRLIITISTVMIFLERSRANLVTKEEHFKSLQQANQELNHFCHCVAHDFKSPLQSINKLSQIFMRDYADKVDSNGQELITHIKNKSAEVVTITDHLLELSRMSQKQIAMVDIKLKPLFCEVYDELIELQPERQVALKLKQLPIIHGDPIMIKILVTNILSNALKYTRNRKQAIIEVTFVEDESNYIISVKDNGAGFDMSESSRLFQIFERLHSIDQFEGTGVGLVVCQKILNRHNGKAWLTGKVNEGAVFSFSFPKNLLL